MAPSPGKLPRGPALVGRVLAIIALLGVLVWLATSCVWTVDQNQQGVVLRFGRAARVVPAGMHLTLPWPVERLVTVATTEVRTMPIGFKLVDRVSGRPAGADERQWLTGDTNIVELEATLNYDVDDPREYLFGASDLANGVSKDFVLRKLCEAAITRQLATLPIDVVLSSGKQELARRARREVQDEADRLRLGITVKGVNVTDVAPPAEVIGAFNDVTTARADRERRVTEANGYERRILPRARATADKAVREAETYAHGVAAEARGAAQAFRELAAEVARHPDIARRRLWLGALERLLPRVRTMIVQPVPEGELGRIYVYD